MTESEAIMTRVVSGLDEVALALKAQLETGAVSALATIHHLRERERAARKEESSIHVAWEARAIVQLLRALPTASTGEEVDVDAAKRLADQALAGVDQVWKTAAPAGTRLADVEGALERVRQTLRDQTAWTDRVRVTEDNANLAAAVFLLTGLSRTI